MQSLTEFGVVIKHPNQWTTEEIDIIRQSVQKLTDVMGGVGAFKAALAGVIFRQSHNPKGYTGALRGTITVVDSTLKQPGVRAALGPNIAMVHEMAHVMDQKTGGIQAWLMNGPGIITGGMPAAIGDEDAPTWYGTTNIVEDWAESVAMYVYPEYSDILIKEGNPRENKARQPGLESRPLHRQYVESQLRRFHND